MWNALNLNAGGSSQVPDQVKPEVAILGGIGPGQPQRFGNAGRNNIRAPRFFNTDLGLFRTFAIKERVNLQFRAEALNVFNHPNFGMGLQFDGNNNVSDPNQFGIINYTVGGNMASGNSGKGTGERQFRFALRLAF